MATVTAVQPTAPQVDQVVWWRGFQGDHAFGTTTDFLRSKCGDVRWTVNQVVIEGTVQACLRCLEAIAPRPVAPASEGELRAAWGDR